MTLATTVYANARDSQQGNCTADQRPIIHSNVMSDVYEFHLYWTNIIAYALQYCSGRCA